MARRTVEPSPVPDGPGFEGEGEEKKYPLYNTSPRKDPENFRDSTRRVLHIATRATPEQLHAGSNWYRLVSTATKSGAKDAGISAWQGAGIVAAVSPNMDWERNNISALGEVRSLSRADWSVIRDSANQPRIPAADGRTKAAPRTQRANELLLEKAPSVAPAPDRNLMKAHQILTGHEVDSVLDRRTAPKTNSFAHNIFDPDDQSFVTIDGRQADMIANMARPWSAGRGISSAALKRGRSRYEDHEDVMRAAADLSRRKSHPLHELGLNAVGLQGLSWTSAKGMELSGTTKAGQPRKQGPARVGQPYLTMSGRTYNVSIHQFG